MDTLTTYFEEEIQAAKAHRARGDVPAAWAALERAHVLGQPRAWLHLVSHWHMATLALTTLDPRELAGQIARVALAAPSSALGVAPVGNDGRTASGAHTPMPVTPELHAKLVAAGVTHLPEVRS